MSDHGLGDIRSRVCRDIRSRFGRYQLKVRKISDQGSGLISSWFGRYQIKVRKISDQGLGDIRSRVCRDNRSRFGRYQLKVREISDQGLGDIRLVYEIDVSVLYDQ